VKKLKKANGPVSSSSLEKQLKGYGFFSGRKSLERQYKV
jgi:hypothetical protein